MNGMRSMHDELPSAADVDDADGLPRRRALGEVLLEVGDTAGAALEPALALRTYGEGCVVLALAGTFGRAGVERLHDLMGDVDRLATVELVVELSLLVGGEPALARALAGLRMRRLVAGTRVELHNPPPELTLELGHTPTQAITVTDTADRTGERAPARGFGRDATPSTPDSRR